MTSPSCRICLEPFDPTQRHLEGHRFSEKVQHLFDAACLRNWLANHADCPLCRITLDNAQLLQTPNPRFSWIQKFYSYRKQICTAIVSLAIASISMHLLESAVSNFAGKYFSGICAGIVTIFSSTSITAIPMIINKIKKNPLVSPRIINKIYGAAVLISFLTSHFFLKNSSINYKIGMIIGIIFANAFINHVESKAYSKLHDGQSFQFGFSPHSFIGTENVIGQIVGSSALAAGITTATHMSWNHIENQGILISTIIYLVLGMLNSFGILCGTAILQLSFFMLSNRFSLPSFPFPPLPDGRFR